MDYAFFLGCTIPARARNYELSARKVAERLGIGLVDIKEFACCGFPVRASDEISAEIMAAYNLCIAGDRGLPLITLCSSCASALTETAQVLSEDVGLKGRVNEALKKTGLEYSAGTQVFHFVRVLFENIEKEAIEREVKRDLSGLKVAIHYGCHYLKPSEVYDSFDSVEDPKSIASVLEPTGVEIVDYPNSKRCCGGPVLPVDEKTAFSMTKAKLDDVKEAGADAICLVCPFCSVMYDGNQKSIENMYGEKYNIPVLYLTQILGLAMGFGRKELGLNMNVVKTKKLLARFFEEDEKQ